MSDRGEEYAEEPDLEAVQEKQPRKQHNEDFDPDFDIVSGR